MRFSLNCLAFLLCFCWSGHVSSSLWLKVSSQVKSLLDHSEVLRNLLLSVPDQASIRQRSPIELKCLNLKGKCRKPHGFVCFVHFIILRKIAQICAKFQKYVQFLISPPFRKSLAAPALIKLNTLAVRWTRRFHITIHKFTSAHIHKNGGKKFVISQ